MPIGKLRASRYIPGMGRRMDIRTDEIDPAAVQNLELADDAVTTPKIIDGAVTDAKITGPISGAKIANTAAGAFVTPNMVLVDHADASPEVLLAADPSNDRLVIVEALVTIAAAGTPDIDVGSATTDPAACFDNLAAGAWLAGERYIGVCALPATEDLVCTINVAGTAGTILFYMLVLTTTAETAQIIDAAVTNAKLAGSITGAKLLDNAVGALPGAANVAVSHGDASPETILVADASNDRIVLVEAVATADAAGSPDYDVGYAGSAAILFDGVGGATFKTGERYIGVCILPATQALICTINVAGTAGAWQMRIVVLTPTVQAAQVLGTLGGAQLTDKYLKDPGAYASDILKMSGVYVQGDRFSIGTTDYIVDAITTDSTDKTANGDFNNTGDPLVVQMDAIAYTPTNSLDTTLNGDWTSVNTVDPLDVVISVATGYAHLGQDGIAPLILNDIILIESEMLQVTNIDAPTKTVTFSRGYGGTAGEPHANTKEIDNIAVGLRYPVTGVGGVKPLVLNEVILVGSEYLLVTDITAGAVQFKRGYGGTTAAAHADAVAINTSAATVAPSQCTIPVQLDFAVATVTPVFARILSHDYATGLKAIDLLGNGTELLVRSAVPSDLTTATSGLSGNGNWFNGALHHGANEMIRRVYSAEFVPGAAEVTDGNIYVLLPFTPRYVEVTVRDSSGADIAWDGKMTITAPSGDMPAYLLLDNSGSNDWSDTTLVHVLAVEDNGAA